MYKNLIIGALSLFITISLSSCINETQVSQSDVITVITKDTSWNNKDLYANSSGKLVNGKLEGDVISIAEPYFEAASFINKYIQKYINGIETGEYQIFDKHNLLIENCEHIKESNLYKKTSYLMDTDTISGIRYIDLKGEHPTLKKLRDITEPKDGLVRILHYEYTNQVELHSVNNGLASEYIYPQSNRKNVQEIFYNKDGTISGKFLMNDDKYAVDGEQILRYGNGNVKQRDIVVNGVYNGPHFEYYESGEVMFEYSYKEGKIHGPFKEYYESGVLNTEREFVDGINRGMINYYSEDGELANSEESSRDKYYREEREKEERRASEKSYSSDGQKCTSCGLGKYQSGFCNMCGGASGQRVNESYSKAANCGFCSGTGLVAKGGIHGGNKICPSCKGKGKQIY
jgi:antitoxin component YwqK of YwqJK toxin-antitoxin module